MQIPVQRKTGFNRFFVCSVSRKPPENLGCH